MANGESIVFKRKDSAGTEYSMYPITTLDNVAGLAEALEAKQGKLTFDSTPTEGSTNPVTSGGVLDYVAANAGGTPIVSATSTDGVTYTATVPGMDSLVVGKEFVIIPSMTSTAINPKLNVNGLGDKYLRCPIGTNNATTTTGATENWIYSGKPVSVRWNGSFWITDIFRADANNLYGTVPVAKGGTGATDAATALTNLGAASQADLDQLSAEKEDKPAAVVGTSIGDKCAEFAYLLNNTDKVESFLFFTDPHLAEGDSYEEQMRSYLKTLKDYYDASPTSFAVCGGDWIGNSDTQKEACFKLGFIDAQMRSNFDRYYPVIGNHDTNYQGVTVEGAEANSGALTNETIRNLMVRSEDNLYYSFDGVSTKFYVLDTGSDWVTAMSDYRWGQIAWLADRLKTDNAKNAALLFHIGLGDYEGENVIQTFASNIMSLCGAFNDATTITLNGSSYDFSGCTGKVRFALTGHVHKDQIETINGIPLIATTNMRDGNTATFDLCIANYDRWIMHLCRVGTGESRAVELVQDEVVVNYTNLVPTAEDYRTDAVFNGVGYKNDFRQNITDTSDGYTLSGYVTVGLIDYVVPNVGLPPVIYIKGNGLEIGTSNDNLISLWTEDKTRKGSMVGLSGIQNYFNITEVSDGYYKLEPVANDAGRSPIVNNYGTGVARISVTLIGTGESLIITLDEPIE